MNPTEQKKMQSKIERLEARVRELESRLSDYRGLGGQLLQARKTAALANLAAGTIHDFNNILQSILGYSQLLSMQRGAAAPEYESLRHIEELVDKGKELTTQFLHVSRNTRPVFLPLNLNAKILEVSEFLGRTIPKMITLEQELADDLGTINADDGQIELLLMDFGLNAMDTMPDGGRLCFRTANTRVRKDHSLRDEAIPPGEYVLLTISDTGHGISLKTPDGVFGPLMAAGGDETPAKGLRLSAVYLIVKNHGGFVALPDMANEGDILEIYFPILSPSRGATPS
jgi:two-component system cell cycle sensor histidine kinase/response regulator CckA